MFKHRVAYCGEYDDLVEVNKSLKALGYKTQSPTFRSRYVKVNGSHGTNGASQTFQAILKDCIITEDKRTFLAIAAIKKEPEFHVGEVLKLTEDVEKATSNLRKGDYIKITSVSLVCPPYFSGGGNNTKYFEYESLSSAKDDKPCFADYSRMNQSFLIKATPEEIVELYTKTKMKEEKKIVGYKTPLAFFGGTVPKGTIFKKPGEDFTWYTLEEEVDEPAPSRIIPKEIVETWEPVYESVEEVLTLGSTAVKITIGKNKIECQGNLISIEEVNYLVNLVGYKKDLKSWAVTVPKVEVGCCLFAEAELKFIKATYERINR